MISGPWPPELEQHLKRLRACRRCPDVQGPPVVGPVPQSRLYLMGQAPGPKERDAGRPFVWTAGTTLFRWFSTLGVSEEMFRQRVYMGAVIRCFPGKLEGRQGDRRPSRTEISTCTDFHQREFALLRPELVILVGKMAIELFLPAKRLDEVVGRIFSLELAHGRLEMLPLPHPSGLNRWIQKDPGKSLLHQALDRLGAHPAWQAEFSPQE